MLTLFLQFLLSLLQNVVAVDVNAHSHNKYYNPQHCHPQRRSNVILISNALQIPVCEGKGESREQNFEGHFCVGFESPWIDDVPIDVMENEQHVREGEFIVDKEEEISCPDKVGYFEEKPSEFGVKEDVGKGRLKAAVVDFNASEHKPAYNRIAHHDVEADGLELHPIGNL